MKKLKKNNKGFSLVEIIVVLVILAILVAASIPILTGYIEEARGKAYLSEARAAYIAAQAYASEKRAAGETIANVQDGLNSVILNGTPVAGADARVESLMKDSYTSGATITGVAITDTKINNFVYTVNGYIITIIPGQSAVVTK